MAALCISTLLHLCLKLGTAVSVLQAQKAGLGWLKFGIQSKSVFEMLPILCFTLPVCKNDDLTPLPSQSITGILFFFKPFNM